MPKYQRRSKQSHRDGGLRAKRKGAVVEREFDEGSRYYRNNFRLHWVPTFPEFVPLGTLTDGRRKGLRYGYFDSKASPDRVVSITELGGKSCWVEIKSASAKDKKTFDPKRDNLHQFDSLSDAVIHGDSLAYYAVRWEYKREIEWRLYSIQSLKRNPDGSLTLVREDGLFVPSPMGWPEWLPVVLEDANATVADAD